MDQVWLLSLHVYLCTRSTISTYCILELLPGLFLHLGHSYITVMVI